MSLLLIMRTIGLVHNFNKSTIFGSSSASFQAKCWVLHLSSPMMIPVTMGPTCPIVGAQMLSTVPCSWLWVFPKIGGKPPKWIIYKGSPYQNGWFGGTTIFRNTHMAGWDDFTWKEIAYKILLMVQKPQGQPPCGCINPCKYMRSTTNLN